MNTTEERIAEIYRRSQMVFHKRKQNRRKIQVICIPTVLCAAIIAAYIWRPSTDKGIAAQNNPTNVAEITAPISITKPTEDPNGLVSVQVLGPMGEIFCNQEDVIIRFQDALDGMTVSAKVNQDIVIGSSGVVNADTKEVYRFILTDGSGLTTEYVCNGSILLNEKSREIYTPDETEILLLFEILGISVSN